MYSFYSTKKKGFRGKMYHNIDITYRYSILKIIFSFSRRF